MKSSNFQPLQKRWPKLFEHAAFAEHYAHSDPHTSIIKLRCFVEQLVGVLYRELNLPCESGDGFFEKLGTKYFLEVIDDSVLQKLHAIRIIGNKAAHGREVEPSDALALVRDAYLTGQWLFKTYSGSVVIDYPDYIEPIEMPVSSDFSTDYEALSEQLKMATEELFRLEAAEEIALQDIRNLKQTLDQERLEAFKLSSVRAATSFDMMPDKTRHIISVHDVYATYSLTSDQKNLVNSLEIFLSGSDSNIFLLKGYAGTGKTFITKGLTEYFKAIGRNYALAAPTGKASKVIADKTQSIAYTIHKTIYSLKDIAQYREENLDGSETYKFYAELRVNDLSADTVFIIDEASMVGDVYQEEEFFRFGSGYVLTDLFKYINLDHNDHRKKLIFIGDSAQLPPVGMNFSPALDEKYLLQKHNVSCSSYELTEVVRQKADSGVMLNAMHLRQAMSKGVYNQLGIDFDGPDIERVEIKDLVNTYLDSCDRKINGQSIVIAHSNADVAEYNRSIRSYFFPNVETVTPGDKVMATMNSSASGFLISNGDFGLIREVLGQPEVRTVTIRSRCKTSNELEEVPITLTFQDVAVSFRDPEKGVFTLKAKILEDLLYSNQPKLNSDQSKALYLDFCIRNSHLKPKSQEFKETLVSDRYFTALRLKFGYAITCHKSQGSEWNNVFVKCKTHHSQLTNEYFRWLYTAITRTKKKLYLQEPPSIQLGSGIKSVGSPLIYEQMDDSIIQPPEHKEMSNASVWQDDATMHSVADNSSTFGIPSHCVLSLTILKHVQGLIGGTEVQVQSVNQNQFQETYFFQKENETCRVDIYYNATGSITRLVAPPNDEFTDYVVSVLTPMIGLTVVAAGNHLNMDQVEFDEGFLNEYHKQLVTLVVPHNISVRDVKSLDWKLQYQFYRGNEHVTIDVFYNGKSQFTKCMPVRSAGNSKALLAEVQQLLTNGFSSC